MADIAAADISVVLLYGLDHFIKSQIVFDHTIRVDAYLELLLVAAPTVHFRRTADRSQLRPDDPVMCRAQFRQLLHLPLFWQPGDVNVFQPHDVMEDFAQARRNRSHLGPVDAGGQFDGSEPLVDQLPREVDINTVLEDHGDL